MKTKPKKKPEPKPKDPKAPDLFEDPDHSEQPTLPDSTSEQYPD